MHQYLMFVLLSVALILLPGPDTALITRTTLEAGRRAGVVSALGISSGLLLHTTAASLGLSALLLRSAYLFETVRYIGAAYLCYLGAMTLRTAWGSRQAASSLPDARQAPMRTLHWHAAYRQGLLCNLLNPKVAVFFLTFLPQFIDAAHPVMAQFFMLGLTYILLTVIWKAVYINFIHYLRTWLSSPRVQRSMEWATGLALVGFGLKLALDRR